MTSTRDGFVPTPIPNPGIRFPPPLIYVAGLVAGWGLQRMRPLTLPDGLGAVRVVLAAACIVAWLLLMLWAFATFHRAHTAIKPFRPARSIVTNGPYRITRNPMYVSMTALYLGITLLINSWWPLLLLLIVLFVIRRFVIAREERYLTDAFPVEYAAYCQRVRRWL